MANKKALIKLRTKLCEEIVKTRRSIKEADDLNSEQHLRSFRRHLISFETELTEVDRALDGLEGRALT